MKIVASSTARSTGTRVLVVDNRDGSFEDDEALGAEANWATVCDTHGNYVLHRTRALAWSFASAPEEFCETCSGES